ncbi:helix-turn-helix domain-containing protein [Bacillus paranthracis]|uniref:helix-turn-helix domain-containing protein n=1 Tax=Bacillus cereus group TaxID=86661 RepID=UPI001F59397C|nr:MULTISPECIES: helix-turn-helix transcriptional regulator [Bacillus cereus group]MCU5020529.1 helix-turn-helix domain-containing protein [Bacillus paranthracis]
MNIKLSNEHIRSEFNTKFPQTGITLKFIAEKIGVNYSNLAKWRNGTHSFAQPSLRKIDKYLATLRK